MPLTPEQRARALAEMKRALADDCWCIVHDPVLDEHNRMPSDIETKRQEAS